MKIGVALRLCRETADLSREQIGKLTGLSAGQVARIEKSQANPRFDTLCSMADAVGVPLFLIVFMAMNTDELAEVGTEIAEILAKEAEKQLGLG